MPSGIWPSTPIKSVASLTFTCSPLIQKKSIFNSFPVWSSGLQAFPEPFRSLFQFLLSPARPLLVLSVPRGHEPGYGFHCFRFSCHAGGLGCLA
jgi:hypothetical protein